ncbi:MAG: capsule assembly Wzi family protein [Ignavibacteriaceae bacterium]
MLKKYKLILLLVFITSAINSNSALIYCQVIYVPLESGVYDFLERQNLKGLIDLNDEVKPFSRMYVAQKLNEIENEFKNNIKSDISEGTKPNNVEIEELYFYSEEYFYELKNIKVKDVPGKDQDGIIINNVNSNQESTLINKNLEERWFLFNYNDSLFNLKLSPIAGYGISVSGKESGHTRWIGLSTFATYSNWFGADFNIRDKGEFGGNVDKEKSFTSVRGAWYKDASNGIEYSDVKGSITFNWSWGSVSLIKDYMQWGHGKFGQLILSDKAPSYPQIRLNLNPVPWLRFSYMHGWLNSLVPDSAAFYYSYPGTISQQLRESYINKYIAANLITVTPWNRIDISAGNAIVYSGEIRPEFFIPFMFYKFLDHNSGRGNVNDGNGMFYLDVSVKYPKNFKFYSTVFVDVTEIRNILDGNYNNTWIGFTFGGKAIDLYLPNLDMTLEYTRINPWVYEHKDEVTTYKHIDYPLGHWLGQNSDQIRLQLNYQLLRGLKFMIFAERIRKGGLDEIYFAYNDIKENGRSFLYGQLRKEYRTGLEVNYEYQHDLNLKIKYTYSDITDEDISRLNSFDTLKNSFSLSIYYNL